VPVDDLFERYRRLVEADAASVPAFDPSGGPYSYVVLAVAAWRGRYDRQREVIDRLPDGEVRRRVMQRGIDADLATAIPDWTPEEWDVYNLLERNQPADHPRITGLHAYGPSLRALWAQAIAGGASPAEAWARIVEWARRPPSKSDFPDEAFAAPRQPPPRPPARVFPAAPGLDPSRLLPRYLAGEREQVWADLMGLGPRALETRFQPHARAVATETMRRARRNVEILIARLRALGYEFWDGAVEWKRSPTLKMGYAGGILEVPNPFAAIPQPPRAPESVFAPAGAELRRQAAGLQLPMSLRAWFEEVGEVDFSGRHSQLCQFDNDPGYRNVDADPLMVFLEPDLELEDQLVISLAAAEKSAQASGAQVDAFYGVQVPNAGADAVLEGAPGQPTFVEYLRHSFEWGGFPGWDGAPDSPRELLRQLSEGLEPI